MLCMLVMPYGCKIDREGARKLAEEEKARWAALRPNWQEGAAGSCNLVSYDGDDIVGIAIVPSGENCTAIAAARTSGPALADLVIVLLERDEMLIKLLKEARVQLSTYGGHANDVIWNRTLVPMFARIDAVLKDDT